MSVNLNIKPIWGTSDTVVALYGVTAERLLELGRHGLIRARKLNPDSRSSRIVFRCEDVEEWLENEAPKPRADAFELRRPKSAPASGVKEV